MAPKNYVLLGFSPNHSMQSAGITEQTLRRKKSEKKAPKVWLQWKCGSIFNSTHYEIQFLKRSESVKFTKPDNITCKPIITFPLTRSQTPKLQILMALKYWA